ncbi:plasmid replication initiator [Acetobacter malorum]|uniref:Plasmid replication initiator n=1 Tax=Acetobacter malorum TaxID=178901 RepID=A0A149URC5_9PROT|nr:replication protein RepA [Acetobacter malorum]KXV70394.1 plasmid replication initiator [Acetobacter malorum]
MGRIHRLLEEHGRQGALALSDDRKELEVAFDFMSDEQSGVGFLFSGWCQAALPHRKQPDDQIWLIETEHLKLMVEPGSVATEEGVIRVGVPYGSRARLILLYLQTEAIKTNSREIELGRSLREWLQKLGVSIGGKSMKDVREQALRLSRCRMTFQISKGNQTGFVNQNIVDTALFTNHDNGGLLETVKLSEGFFEQLKKHPVPLQESAIRAIANNSQALDIYCWLAYRLHVLPGDCQITWKALYAQFGRSYARLRKFRENFLESLKIALAVYPDARVTTTETGVILHSSKPPVPQKTTPQIKPAKKQAL